MERIQKDELIPYNKTDPDITKVIPFRICNWYGILFFSKRELFIRDNEDENKYADPKKQEDNIIDLYICIYDTNKSQQHFILVG